MVDCSLLLWRHPSPLDIADFGGVLNVPTVMIDAMAGMERAGTQVEGVSPVSCPATSITFHVIGRSCERWSATMPPCHHVTMPP